MPFRYHWASVWMACTQFTREFHINMLLVEIFGFFFLLILPKHTHIHTHTHTHTKLVFFLCRNACESQSFLLLFDYLFSVVYFECSVLREKKEEQEISLSHLHHPWLNVPKLNVSFPLPVKWINVTNWQMNIEKNHSVIYPNFNWTINMFEMYAIFDAEHHHHLLIQHGILQKRPRINAIS